MESSSAKSVETSSPLSSGSAGLTSFVSNIPQEALDIASRRVCNKTRSKYSKSMGHNVSNFTFTSFLVIGFFLSLYNTNESIGTILMARAAIS